MVSTTDNSTWVRALCRQEHDAFAALMTSYRPAVAACSRRCGLREHDVEDVVSSTFLKAYQALPNYRGEAAVGTWLCRIAYHQSMDRLRQIGHARRCQAHWALRETAGDPFKALEQVELKNRLEDALSQLPVRWLQAITLHYWNHMSIAQIARVMQVRNGAVRSYLFRGRRQLRSMLEW
jgi:RNA polymerase sigma-70 factor (ECF subfamily)